LILSEILKCEKSVLESREYSNTMGPFTQLFLGFILSLIIRHVLIPAGSSSGVYCIFYDTIPELLAKVGLLALFASHYRDMMYLLQFKFPSHPVNHEI
jgi:hypothetical protein